MAARLGRDAGGICWLVGLIDEHRAAVEYDFRSRFHLSAEVIGAEMGWDEAIRLVGLLRKDPGSWLSASMEGWDYPITREDAVLRDLWDLQYAKTGAKNRKPYQRPFKATVATEKKGSASGLTREQAIARLDQFGKAAPV